MAKRNNPWLNEVSAGIRDKDLLFHCQCLKFCYFRWKFDMEPLGNEIPQYQWENMIDLGLFPTSYARVVRVVPWPTKAFRDHGCAEA